MKPSWTIQKVPEKGLLLVTTKGTITPTVSDRIMREIAALKLDPEKVRILVDHRAAQPKFHTIDLFELPQTYQIVPGSTRFWVATVFKQVEDNQEFYKEMCRKHGLTRFEIFADYDAAVAWLTSPERR